MEKFYNSIFFHPLFGFLSLLGLIFLGWCCWKMCTHISNMFRCCGNNIMANQDTSFFQSQVMILPPSPTQEKKHRQALKEAKDSISRAEEGLID